MMLTKMKETAEAYLGKEVKQAVITVPASFNSSRHQPILYASQIAGLEVLDIICHCTAAALAYGLENQLQPHIERNILVFDLGVARWMCRF
jgi:L1 cell adhesion molecule like protein